MSLHSISPPYQPGIDLFFYATHETHPRLNPIGFDRLKRESRSKVGMTLKAKLYPNGEVSFYLDRLKPMEAMTASDTLSLEQEGTKATIKNHGIDAAIDFYTTEGNQGLTGHLPGLVKSALFMQHQEGDGQSRRGMSGMTRYSRRLIECGATVIENTVGKELCSFLTLTFPCGDGDWTTKQVNKAYNNFQTALLRKLAAVKLPGLIIGCIEAQPNQSEKEGRFVPHYHLLFQGRLRYESWAIHKNWFRDTWWRCLSNAGVVDSTGDKSACSRVEQVKKSVSAYMGKYLSKAAKIAKECSESATDIECPGSWHKVSRKMLDAIKKSIKIRRGEQAYRLLELLRGEKSTDVIFEYTLYLQDEFGGKFWIGQYYRIHRNSIESILQACGGAFLSE